MLSLITGHELTASNVPGYDAIVMLDKEPWDSSSEKAKALRIDDFGIPEEVRQVEETLIGPQHPPLGTTKVNPVAGRSTEINFHIPYHDIKWGNG